MRVLLSNDDGIHAQGLKTLQAALDPLCELWVVAPSDQQSAMSHSLTLESILRRRQWGERRFSVSGTPADSVLMGCNDLLRDSPPDLVISGINHGPNMGEDVHYSGTVAAAFEAAILGFPAIAVSLSAYRDLDFNPAADFIASLMRSHPELLCKQGTLLNINVPNLPSEQLRGVAVTRMGTRDYGDVIMPRQDPRGGEYFWIGGEEPTWQDQPDSDFYAVHQDRKISVTPLKVDITDHERISSLSSWMELFD